MCLHYRPPTVLRVPTPPFCARLDKLCSVHICVGVQNDAAGKARQTADSQVEFRGQNGHGHNAQQEGGQGAAFLLGMSTVPGTTTQPKIELNNNTAHQYGSNNTAHQYGSCIRSQRARKRAMYFEAHQASAAYHTTVNAHLSTQRVLVGLASCVVGDYFVQVALKAGRFLSLY